MSLESSIQAANDKTNTDKIVSRLDDIIGLLRVISSKK